MAGQTNAHLFVALERAAGQRVSYFNTQGPTNTPWVFATDAQMFAALASAVEQRVSDFNMQGRMNTA